MRFYDFYIDIVDDGVICYRNEIVYMVCVYWNVGCMMMELYERRVCYEMEIKNVVVC